MHTYIRTIYTSRIIIQEYNYHISHIRFHNGIIDSRSTTLEIRGCAGVLPLSSPPEGVQLGSLAIAYCPMLCFDYTQCFIIILASVGVPNSIFSLYRCTNDTFYGYHSN